ncbi:MAG TPA: helix-turn-helix domain-containing protein [Actinomycetota bacterium]|nr:helix-turn-helix domain-containing protein [Actinomycetota bacterium]
MVTERTAGRTRDEILRATGELIAEGGFLAATTRAIAERAGCAEGSIYRYFPDKHALVHAVMFDRFESFFVMVEELPGRAGQDTVAGNLERVALEALRFYRGITPLVGAQLSDPRLMAEQRAAWGRENGGPMRAIRAVRAYVDAEQRLGRIAAAAEPDLLGREVLGTCFAHAILESLVGGAATAVDREGTPFEDEPYVRHLVGSILRGAGPGVPA